MPFHRLWRTIIIMWKTFERVVRKCRMERCLLGAVTITSLYKSWQRPGVAANYTVNEFWQAVHGAR